MPGHQPQADKQLHFNTVFASAPAEVESMIREMENGLPAQDLIKGFRELQDVPQDIAEALANTVEYIDAHIVDGGFTG